MFSQAFGAAFLVAERQLETQERGSDRPDAAPSLSTEPRGPNPGRRAARRGLEARVLLYLARVMALGALYFSAGRLGLWIDTVSGFAAPVWPPAGIALAALFLVGYRLWPGVALGAFLVHLSAGAPALAAGGMALGNSAEALLGTLLLRQVVQFEPSLARMRDVLGLVFCAAGLSTLVSATVGVTSGWLAGVISTAQYASAWRTCWIGHVIGDLLVAPLLFTWVAPAGVGESSRSRHPSPYCLRPRLAEAAVSASALAASGFVFCFSSPSPTGVQEPYLVFPILIWAALRFGPRGAASALDAVAVVAIAGTARGTGPFASGTLSQSLLAVQSFMSVTAVTILMLAAVVRERERVEEALRFQTSFLEAQREAGIEGILVVDEQGRMISFNRRFIAMWGIPEEVVASRSDEAALAAVEANLLHPRQFRERIAYLYEHPEQQSVDEIALRDGRTIERYSAPVRGRDGKHLGRVWFFRDITGRKQMEAALEELSGRLLRLQDEERRRIGRELHDGTAQTLAALAFCLETVDRGAAPRCPTLRDTLAEAHRLVEQSIREVRTVAYLLHPPILDEVGLAPALAWYARGFSERSGIPVELDLDLGPERDRFSPALELTVFRIVQESLANIHRHSHARCAGIRLARHPAALELAVQDDGHGFEAFSPAAGPRGGMPGVGIASMRERARPFGGSLEIASSPAGTVVKVVFPLPEACR